VRIVLGARREVYRVYEEDELDSAGPSWDEEVRGRGVGGAGTVAALVALSLTAATSAFLALQIGLSGTGARQSGRSRTQRLVGEVAKVKRARSERRPTRSRADAVRDQPEPASHVAPHVGGRHGSTIAAAVRANRSVNAGRHLAAPVDSGGPGATVIRATTAQASPRSEFGFEQ
jgi:hypothetical protein